MSRTARPPPLDTSSKFLTFLEVGTTNERYLKKIYSPPNKVETRKHSKTLTVDSSPLKDEEGTETDREDLVRK